MKKEIEIFEARSLTIGEKLFKKMFFINKKIGYIYILIVEHKNHFYIVISYFYEMGHTKVNLHKKHIYSISCHLCAIIVFTQSLFKNIIIKRFEY